MFTARITVLLILLFLSTMVGAKTLHSEKSMYRNIVVTETRGERCMIFGSLSRRPTRQSCFDVRDPERLVFSYSKLVLAGFTQIPQSPERILIIGLGGGTLPMTLERIYPDAIIDTAEIDPAVVQVARDWFLYKDSDKQKIHTIDGRVFVKKQLLRQVKYDVIILDAFNGDYIPEHMMTEEYFKEIKGILSPDGLLIANTFSTNKLYHHESVTYQKVFGDFYYAHSDRSGNRIIFGNLKEPNAFESDPKVREVKAYLREIGVNFRLFNRLLSNRVDWDETARSLTDQFSPANLLNQS